MFFAIDIGNTSTTFGVTDGAGWRAVVWRDTATICALEILPAVLRELGIAAAHVTTVGIASVVPAIDTPFVAAVHNSVQRTPIFLTVANYPHAIRYPHPQEIGADRLADAAGALHKFRPPFIILDFGTATTFEYVDADGAYCGGPIMPGVLLAQRALADAAAKLPSVDFAPVEMLIPRTTSEAVQSGMFLGTVGAVDYILNRMIAEVGGSPQLIATGGLAATVVPALQHQLTIEPTLTLDGIYVCLR